VAGDAAATDLTYSTCSTSQMLRTVVVNKKLLLRFVDEFVQSPSGAGADLLTAVQKAQALLAAQRTHRTTHYASTASADVVVVLTGSGAAAGTTSSAWGAERSTLPATAEGTPGAVWLLHTIGGEPSAVAGNLASVADRSSTLTASAAGFDPARYYTLPALELTATASTPFASAFYEDSFGLGLVTTMVGPVYVGGALKAVVGVDVTVLELVSDLVFDTEFTSSYSFLVDSTGQVVWHPSLPSPKDAKAVEPISVLQLETSAGFRTSVYPGLVAGTVGSATVTVNMVQAHGDATYAGFGHVERSVAYSWRSIAGTSFRLCVALTSEDSAGKTLSSPPDSTTCTSTDSCTVEMGGGKAECQVYNNLGLGHTCGGTPSSGTVPQMYGKAGTFFAASAFAQPAGWLEHPETFTDAHMLAQAHTCSACGAPTVSKTVGQLKAAAINDNMLARKADTCWKSQQALSSTILWTYFGSANGLFRTMPAHQSKKGYEAAKRPWYLGAVANRHPTTGYGTTISTPYLDAAGGGEVVTIARVVTRGGAVTDPVAGVVGADLKLPEVKRVLDGLEVCGASTTCMLLDTSGHLIYHPDFAATTTADANVFLSTKHRELAKVTGGD
jgi:hypothetical protein